MLAWQQKGPTCSFRFQGDGGVPVTALHMGSGVNLSQGCMRGRQVNLVNLDKEFGFYSVNPWVNF